MMDITLFLLIAALILFLAAAFAVPVPRGHLGWLGLACVALSWVLNV